MSDWVMWAAADDRGDYHDFGVDRRYTLAHGHSDPVQVRLVERQDGPYWGWLGSRCGEPSAPSMVYRRKVLFDVCFPYSAEAEAAAGNGRIVRLAVEPIAADTPTR